MLAVLHLSEQLAFLMTALPNFAKGDLPFNLSRTMV